MYTNPNHHYLLLWTGVGEGHFPDRFEYSENGEERGLEEKDTEEEDEEEGMEKMSVTGSLSGGETDNEEFCDTSDEPVEVRVSQGWRSRTQIRSDWPKIELAEPKCTEN